MFLMHKAATGFSRISSKRTKPCKTVICIGSGGHTTEMLQLLRTLDFGRYSPRYYIMASSDKTSPAKILAIENSNTDFEIVEIPRSRIVGQSYITSVFTTLYSILYSVPVVCRIRPDLVLCNGPGTCIPICVTAFLLKAGFVSDTRIVFVESFCRTRSFSLSGKILMYFADNILVQWPKLRGKLKRAEYIGQLMWGAKKLFVWAKDVNVRKIPCINVYKLDLNKNWIETIAFYYFLWDLLSLNKSKLLACYVEVGTFWHVSTITFFLWYNHSYNMEL